VIVIWPVLADPVPESATFCGLPLALSVKLSVALRVPAAVGLNCTLAEQLEEAARLVVHVLPASTKSPAFVPEIATLLMVMAEESPFDNVADCAALVAPMVVLANVRLDGLAETVALPPVPSPVRVTLCGLPVAESLNVRIAERFPFVVGAKTTDAAQLAEAASEAPHVLLLIWKSPGFVPEIATLLIVIADVPLFVSVAAFGAPLFPTATDTQFSVVGDTVAVPELVVPVPESATFCGLPVALSVKLRVALRLPEAPGLNVTDAVQLADAASVLPQVLLDMAKSAAFVPEIATLLMVIDDVSPFFRVADCAAVVEPTVVLAKVSEAGLADTVPLVEVPVPVKATFCGLPLPESLKLSVAARAPVAVGAKTIFAVQLAEAASDDPQVLLKTLKSAAFVPVIVMLVIVIADAFVLLSVTTFCAPVFPSATETQLRLVGEADTAAKALAWSTPATKTLFEANLNALVKAERGERSQNDRRRVRMAPPIENAICLSKKC
jgi:hypothetical protein